MPFLKLIRPNFQVEAVGISDAIKIPIAVLKVGEQRTVQSFLEFPDAPVTFRLIQGAGPVYIHGHHLLGKNLFNHLFHAELNNFITFLGEFEEMEDNELGDEDEELEDIEQEEIPEDENDEQPKKKAKLAVNSNNSKGNAVKAATNNKPKK